MSDKKAAPSSIEEVAEQTKQHILRYYATDTTEADEKREAERDARIAVEIAKLAAQGLLPPRHDQSAAVSSAHSDIDSVTQPHRRIGVSPEIGQEAEPPPPQRRNRSASDP